MQLEVLKLKTVVVKLGMILLKLNRNKAEELDVYLQKPEIDSNYYTTMVNYMYKAKAILETRENIIQAKWLGEPLEEHFDPFETYQDSDDTIFVMQSTGFLHLTCCLPRDERTYYREIRYIPKVIEQFDILYNGQFFIAFAEVESLSESNFFGQEVRAFLSESLEGEDWEVSIFPPCPIHPDIHLIFSEEDTEGLLKSPRDSDETIRYYFPMNMYPDVLEIIETIVTQNAFELEYFMSLCSLKTKLETIKYDIEEKFDALVMGFKEANLVERSIFLRKTREIYSLKKMVFELQLGLNEFTRFSMKLESELDDFKTNYSKDSLFNEYFQNHITTITIPIERIKETTQYIESQFSNTFLGYNAVLAGTLGALVGSLLSNMNTIGSIFNKVIENIIFMLRSSGQQ